MINGTKQNVVRLPFASVALAMVILAPVAGTTPALCQDFSITNQVAPAPAGRRDVMRQLQAWWDVHAYYPRRASNSGDDGTVKIRLVIPADGVISAADVVESSGSRVLDRAGIGAFTGGFVRPLPEGTPDTRIELSLHYVLTSQRNRATAASYPAGSARAPFTITDDPIKSPILEAMLQRTCTGTVVKEGVRNHPQYGSKISAEAVFFRRPDGTPWVKFYEGGFPILSPVTEVGKLVQWTGREEHVNRGLSQFTQYTVWPDGNNNLGGYIDILYPNHDPDAHEALNHGGTVDLICASDLVPAIPWSAWSVTPGRPPAGDPP